MADADAKKKDVKATEGANDAPEAAEEKKKAVKKKGKKRSVPEANLYIIASFNNTIVTITDPSGNVLCWSSAGSSGFKGTRKATPYAASVAVENALNKAKVFGVERVHIAVKGIGTGRDQALRAVSGCGVQIESIRERTAVPHNGCRPRKAPRN
ncbi:30S ribosomal protein S11 [Candidatus Peregrinibacteria bacterium CG11_big_fil_rev_8_21_14_0_20_46_8]|nr:MAG: 30S ribosomal protein S11 [Candidatus Peregrinibacteria bacterium CG11_big_fil_rev_8_21_14_0_20_46_8]